MAGDEALQSLFRNPPSLADAERRQLALRDHMRKRDRGNAQDFANLRLFEEGLERAILDYLRNWGFA